MLSRILIPVVDLCVLSSFLDYRRTLWYIGSMSKGVLNIRGVPTDLIRRAKSAAALQGVTLREWVLKAIEEKLKKGAKQ
jgi:hypothetical protein